MTVHTPKVSIGECCSRNMHDLCSWDSCQCGCHIHKKIESLRNNSKRIVNPDILENKVHWRNKKHCH